MPRNITIRPSNLVPEALRRPTITFDFNVPLVLEVVYAAGVLIADQFLMTYQSGCTQYQILVVLTHVWYSTLIVVLELLLN